MVFCICGNFKAGDSDVPPRDLARNSINIPSDSHDHDGRDHLVRKTDPITTPTSKRVQINESIMNETTTPGTPSKFNRGALLDDHPVDSGLCSIEDCSHVNGCPSMIPFTPSSDFPKDLLSVEHSVMDDLVYSNNMETSPDDLVYIDEFGFVPEDHYNSATAVSFFSMCSATMGYPTARLLQFRLSGIMSIPESPLKRNLDCGL
jgi:hypothetical protein